ncbi:hypothetical protein SAMN02927895_03661 [Belnapia rosea]|uniref:Lipoprotein n=1 Tax=Belnapia rosea TaxID=938405 RepID=A0A1G6XGG7_9PROT|nr:hypothetical protein SAMN02927895_03661 [Belnapia rosea]SDD77308.1 hypothetical protein SAMN04487779_101255 [Belnapia rosea]
MDLKRLPSLRTALPLALLAAGCILSPSAHAAPPELEAPSLVSPSLGCGASPAANVLLGRVAMQRHQNRARPRRPHRRNHIEAAPVAEPVASLSQAFYTCATTPLFAIPVGTGWLAVGPVRRS